VRVECCSHHFVPNASGHNRVELEMMMVMVMMVVMMMMMMMMMVAITMTITMILNRFCTVVFRAEQPLQHRSLQTHCVRVRLDTDGVSYDGQPVSGMIDSLYKRMAFFHCSALLLCAVKYISYMLSWWRGSSVSDIDLWPAESP